MHDVNIYGADVQLATNAPQKMAHSPVIKSNKHGLRQKLTDTRHDMTWLIIIAHSYPFNLFMLACSYVSLPRSIERV